ncbi:hypothetical protein F2P56_012699 [Juglans regia]|uniref:Uncharacterized protein n=1 Tax=Juglans regia TaxID=51240 RepID=A0A833XP09_JUGRE|nr:hypothetical protein F2P56_012699 [Juglans regia]
MQGGQGGNGVVPGHGSEHREGDDDMDQAHLPQEKMSSSPDMEKSGGKDRPERQMRAFRQLLDDCSLVDLGFEGPKFTWCNGRDAQHIISERIDRYLANQRWLD